MFPSTGGPDEVRPLYRLIVTGGGTGGHIYPALSIADGFARRHPSAEVLYVGTREGLEAQVVPSRGLPFQTVEVRGLVGKSPRNLIRGLSALRRGMGQARSIVRQFAPDAVVGTGGYVSGPVVWAAARLGVPALVQEQNAVPGVTNRLLALVADRVLVPHQRAAGRFPRRARTVVTGNPVRREIVEADRDLSRRALGFPPQGRLVLAVGGSRGAATLNRALLDLVRQQPERGFHLLWIAGQVHHHQIQSELQAGDLKPGGDFVTRVLPYTDQMPEALAAADLAVARAGAMTLAEITARGLPSILIPFPHATHQHQEWNARALAEAGAAVVLRNGELTGAALWRQINGLLASPENLEAMALQAGELGRPEALEAILNCIDALVAIRR